MSVLCVLAVIPCVSYGADSAIHTDNRVDDVFHAGSDTDHASETRDTRDTPERSSSDAMLTTNHDRPSQRTHRNDVNAFGNVNNPDHGGPTAHQALDQALVTDQRHLRDDQKAGNVTAVAQDRQDIEGAKENLATQHSNVQNASEEHSRGDDHAGSNAAHSSAHAK